MVSNDAKRNKDDEREEALDDSVDGKLPEPPPPLTTSIRMDRP